MPECLLSERFCISNTIFRPGTLFNWHHHNVPNQTLFPTDDAFHWMSLPSPFSLFEKVILSIFKNHPYTYNFFFITSNGWAGYSTEHLPLRCGGFIEFTHMHTSYLSFSHCHPLKTPGNIYIESCIMYNALFNL